MRRAANEKRRRPARRPAVAGAARPDPGDGALQGAAAPRTTAPHLPVADVAGGPRAPPPPLAGGGGGGARAPPGGPPRGGGRGPPPRWGGKTPSTALFQHPT